VSSDGTPEVTGTEKPGAGAVRAASLDGGTPGEDLARTDSRPGHGSGDSRSGVRRTLDVLAVPAISIVLALVVGALIITASSVTITGSFDPTLWIEAYVALIEGGLGIGSESPLNALSRTITNSAPLLLAGLSVALGFKAGLFNIGATGQFVIAGLVASIVGAEVADQNFVLSIGVAAVAGCAAGALYGFIPGFLKATTGAHEVVTTIMLNYIAFFTGTALVINVFRSPDFTYDRTGDIGAAALPVLFGRDLHLGVLIAYACVPIFWWFVWRTTIGFEIRTVGANPSAARYAGMSPKRTIMLTMTLCGFLAGLAGVIIFLGEIGFYPSTFGTQIGFDAIAIALLGRSHPVGVMLGALLFGFLRAGAPLMQIRAGIPIEIIDVLTATILFFLAADIIVRRLFRMRGAKGMTGADHEQQFTKSYGGEVA
jgi:simple sugar transport system permease protein